MERRGFFGRVGAAVAGLFGGAATICGRETVTYSPAKESFFVELHAGPDAPKGPGVCPGFPLAPLDVRPVDAIVIRLGEGGPVQIRWMDMKPGDTVVMLWPNDKHVDVVRVESLAFDTGTPDRPVPTVRISEEIKVETDGTRLNSIHFTVKD